jgi:uncharacterized OB-fold protein
MSEPRPIAAADSCTQQWWDATREERFLLQRCARCNHVQFYPRALCTSCGSTELTYEDASGHGTIYSFTVVGRAPHPAFTPPYIVALVRLTEGPVVLTNIVGTDVVTSGDVRCDQPVHLRWEELPDGRKLPLFEPFDLLQGD